MTDVDTLIREQRALLLWHLKKDGLVPQTAATDAQVHFKQAVLGPAVLESTLLSPLTTPDHISALCAEAKEHQFRAVCVPPCLVQQAAVELEGSPVLPITVVSFPLGYTTSALKAIEAESLVAAGAREIDMVIHLGHIKSKAFSAAFAEILQVVKTCSGVPVKVIIEAAALSLPEKIQASLVAAWAGASFVKTSTGFGPGGATLDDVRLIRRCIGPNVGVKASGGIKDAATASAMLKAGANTLGTSQASTILHQLNSEETHETPGHAY